MAGECSPLSCLFCVGLWWVKGATGDCNDLLEPTTLSCPHRRIRSQERRWPLSSTRCVPSLSDLDWGHWEGAGSQEKGICFPSVSPFLFLFRISQLFGGWAVTQTDFLNSPLPSPRSFLGGVAIPPPPPFSNLTPSHCPGKCE